jgi:hypothetical protein
MLKSSLIGGSVILALLYIGFGDQIEVLPENVRDGSTTARTTIVEFGGKLVPDWVKKTKDSRDDMLEQDPESNQSE